MGTKNPFEDKQFKALLGATVMLIRIRNGESFSVVEFAVNLRVYQDAIIEEYPAIVDDPWFGKFITKR